MLEELDLDELIAPFPYFGGKRAVAHLIWPRLGPDVPNYIEPFFGSGAVLLQRPGGAGKIETINDIDRYVANFWRAIKANPWAVAEWCDDPVNEADMHARHHWLVSQTDFKERMHTDPDYYDAKIAGWWCWGICCWIGAGWCAEPNNRKHPKLDGIGKGVHSQRGDGTKRQKRQLPDLSVSGTNGLATGRGVHGARGRERNRDALVRPHLSSDVGVHSLSAMANLPALGNDRGIHGVSAVPETYLHALRALQVPDAPPCFRWFMMLMLRLRRVRVACGDYKRVLGRSVLGKGKNVGGRRPVAVFFDPPYDPELRAKGLYLNDTAVSHKVREWCLKNGNDPDIRIALCGYEGEHDMPDDWEVVEWEGRRGYSKASNKNRKKERIWFNPSCLKPEKQRSLLDLIPPEHR